MSCCSQFCSEVATCCVFRHQLFVADDGNGNVIDIPASFSPRGILSILIKIGTCALAIVTMYLSISKEPRPFWLAYLTHWSLIMAIAYLLLSCFNTAVPFEQPSTPTSPTGLRLALTWVLFEIASHSEVVVSILYWSMVYEGDGTGLVSILGHGVIMALVLVEGLWVNRVPVRLSHYWFVLAFDIIYVLWSFLHSVVFDIGNPDEMDNDPDTNDDAIYKALDWVNDPGQARALSVIVVGVLGPLMYLLIWMLSIYSPVCSCSGSNRRLYKKGSDEKRFRRMTEI